MANLLEKLRKENNERDKLLSAENNRIMMDMVVFLRGSNLCDYDLEVIRRELFGMVYEAQLRNESAEQVIGEDYKRFCQELMENGRQKSKYEKFLEWAYIVIVGAGVLFLIELVFSGFFIESFTHGNFDMPVSLGFAVSTVLAIAGSVVLYWFVTKYSFELPGNGMGKYKIYFITGFMLYFSAVVMIKVLLDDVYLFKINVIIPVFTFAAAYLLVKFLGDRNADLIAETHK